MKKDRIILSVSGMEESNRRVIEEQMNDESNDKYVWVFNKPVTVDHVELSADKGFSYSGNKSMKGWSLYRTFFEGSNNEPIKVVLINQDGELKEFKLDE